MEKNGVLVGFLGQITNTAVTDRPSHVHFRDASTSKWFF